MPSSSSGRVAARSPAAAAEPVDAGTGRPPAADAGYLAAALAAVPLAVVGLDADAVVQVLTLAAAELLGVHGAAITGRPLAEAAVLTDGSGEPIDLLGGVRRELAGVVRRRNGSTVAAVITVVPLAGAGVLVALTASPAPAQQPFLANASHALRTPLTPIRGYAEILRRHPGLPAEKITGYAETILASALRLARVVDLVVEVSAVESGRAAVARRLVGVDSFLEERLRSWQARGSERSGDLAVELEAALPAVQVDPVWLAKILDELLDNALRWSTVGTPVVLTARSGPLAGTVRVGVRDAGEGLNPVIEAALMDPLGGDVGAGLGVGLAFVHRLAARLELPLSVLRAAPAGTEVTLDLPAAPPSR